MVHDGWGKHIGPIAKVHLRWMIDGEYVFILSLTWI